MEQKFTSSAVPLAEILGQAGTGELQLPDFQRGWVWDDRHIVSLLASVSLSFPIGAVMTLQTGNPKVRFRPRALEGVALQDVGEPDLLLLDGQQRSTSLYLALKSGQPVPTRDARKKRYDRWYYADMPLCLDEFTDREDAIVSVPADRVIRNFRGESERDLSTRDREVSEAMFPLGIVLDPMETSEWQFKYIEDGPGTKEERWTTWQQFHARIVRPFVQYQVPVIQLAKATPKEAVCQVFEKVNTGGVTLSVFELMTATYAADDFNLRDDWKKRRERFDQYPSLSRFSETDFLQVVTLLATYSRRMEVLAANPEDEKAPAVSCKRKDILKLELADYRKWTDPAADAIERVVPFLHAEHIFTSRDMPYRTQLVPLGAILALLQDHHMGMGVRAKLRRWLWCGVFGEMYGGSTETRFAYDVQEVVKWIEEDGPEPRTIREAQFQADRLLTLRTRNSAAYKGLYALQMKRGGRDFRTGAPIDVHAYFDDSIDIHHIFPRAWCDRNGIDSHVADSVVNKTAIDSSTNRRIGGRAPSEYLATLERREETEPAELDEVLRSHDIDPIPLRGDDFGVFFNLRFERMIKQIEEAMGKTVNRSADRDESPFHEAEGDLSAVTQSVRDVVAAGESRVREFKSTGRVNLHTEQRDDRIEWAVVKTVVGFMNAHGGTLLVGVADDGAPIGIGVDYPTVLHRNSDGWELWLTDLLKTTLGAAAAADVAVAIVDLDGFEVARVDVGPAVQPVFAKPKSGDRKEKFLVRINNGTDELVGQDALDYQRKRWPQ